MAFYDSGAFSCIPCIWLGSDPWCLGTCRGRGVTVFGNWTSIVGVPLLCTSCMSPACLFHWKMTEKCRCDWTQSVPGARCLEPHLKLSEKKKSLPLGSGGLSIKLCIALRSQACAWRCPWPSVRRRSRAAGWYPAVLVLWLTEWTIENVSSPGHCGMGGRCAAPCSSAAPFGKGFCGCL